MTVAADSQHDEQQLIMLYRGGLSVRQAAIATGISPTTAHRVLSSRGVAMRSPGGVKGRAMPQGMTADAENRAVRLYVVGKSLHDVGAELGGVSGETIARHLRDLQVPVREPSRTLASGGTAEASEILRIHAARRSVAETAKLAGCSPARVSLILRGAGIEVRSGRPANPLPAPAELAAAFAAAGSIRELARRLHVSEARLREALPSSARTAARRRDDVRSRCHPGA
jgi:hypothetical protein